MQMAEIRLLAVDLDGTLMGGVEDLPRYAGFREKLLDLKKAHNTVWAICTGRSLGSFRRFFTPMQMMGVHPDFVIIKHAYIYGYSKRGRYFPHILWNLRTGYLLWTAEREIRDTINEADDLMTKMTHKIRIVRRTRDRIWVRFENEESCAAVARELSGLMNKQRNMRLLRFRQEIDIREVPFTKGLAVSQLARHLRIPRANVLTIGDGHNDISMLQGNVAVMKGCPANSEAEVMQVVSTEGGHVARGDSISGVTEIIDAYLSDKVCSNLPADWRDPAQSENPAAGNSRHHGRHRSKKNGMWTMLLVVAVIYTVLLVFANSNLIPYVSKWIRLPFESVVRLIQRWF
jgi:HAD superfamily hydrolase (TIGR01484 family)